MANLEAKTDSERIIDLEQVLRIHKTILQEMKKRQDYMETLLKGLLKAWGEETCDFIFGEKDVK
jgi:hypothetical protein